MVDGTIASSTEDINYKFDALREKLLDLTMRNQLLNFRPRTRVIKVVDEISTEIYDILVLQEKKMQFLPKPEKDQEIINEESEEDDSVEMEEEESDILWELPPPDLEVDDRHKDLFLQTKLEPKELQKRLFNIFQRAKTVFEEQGYNILYLALGLLEWTEAEHSHDIKKAPLILIPVKMKRKGVKRSFKVEWAGDDIITNISLQAKLKEQGINLPDFEMPEDKHEVYNYFKRVEDAVSKMKNWNLRNDIYLGFFSFTKFVMYQDLNAENWPSGFSFEKNPIINSLFNQIDYSNEPSFDQTEVDTKLSSKEVYTVLDADSSQVAVIEDVKTGKNLVVEGPPGTGKSQTIVNLIAELIAAGKSVLFVSEKMAALEVVKSRLDSVNLGDFCLELHSHKSNKKEVLKELERTLLNTTPKVLIEDEKFQELDKIRTELNDYKDTIHTPYGAIGLTPFQLIGLKEKSLKHFENSDKEFPVIPIENPLDVNRETWQESLNKLEDIVELLKSLTPIKEHPWHDCHPNLILPADSQEIKGILDSLLSSLNNIKSRTKKIEELTGVKKAVNIEEIEKTEEIVQKILQSDFVEEGLLTNTAWEQDDDQAQQMIQKVEDYQQKMEPFHEDALEADVETTLMKFKQASENLFQVNSSEFNAHETEIKKLLEDSKRSLEELNSSIDILNQISGVKKANNWAELDKALDTASKIASSPQIDFEVMQNPEWDIFSQKAQQILIDIENFQKHTSFLEKFKDDVLDNDINQIHKKFVELSGKMLKFLSGDYKKTKNLVTSFYQSDPPKDNDILIEDLKNLIKVKELQDIVRSSDAAGRSLFGLQWMSEKSDPQKLRSLGLLLVEFRSLLKDGIINQDTLRIINTCSNSDEINNCKKNIMSVIGKVSAANNKLEHYFNRDKIKKGIDFNQLQSENHGLEKKVLNYFEVREEIQDYFVQKAPESNDQLASALNDLIESRDLNNHIERFELKGKSLYGRKWQGKNSNIKEIRSLSEFLVEFRTLLKNGQINNYSIKVISNPNRPDIDFLFSEIHEEVGEFFTHLKQLDKYIHMDCDALFNGNIKNVSLGELESQFLSYKENQASLITWAQYNSEKKELTPFAQPIVESINSGLLEPADVIPAFNGNLADSILRILFSENVSLRNFVGDLHENKIQKFNNLDQHLLKLNRKRIAQEIKDSQPNLSLSLSRNSELGILRNEFSRKRGHMPIRKLLYAAGGLIQAIKPCFMMSPLSVAQFLDPNSADHFKFDVVIFDEASQVKPEDALGSFLRGKQLVVMGDTKQLPPTTFFDSILDTEESEDYEISSLMDMESILHFCKSSFPTRMLNWHYRSRHESLIAVSNQEFYDNQLLIYPSPQHQTETLGLKYVNLDWKTAYYDRGRSSVNRGEAKAVVNAAIEHFKKYGDTKSLGIGTFNTNQQRAILEEIEMALKTLPNGERERLEKYFNQEHEEKFFVKNLETIQGDERDVILVSVGFGFESSRKFSYNFGPLNRDGGERRLNVLFTRAKEKCVIFSNFTHSQIEIKPNSPFGLKALKMFLAYAENKELLQIDTPLEDTDSPFEDSVYEFLRSRGYQVHKQVGCAGYRIDLAVVDPESPGRYLLGIECDGAMYHSSPVARDRDRLRQQVLEGLGWNIYRIWSTDWYKKREDSIKRLLDAIKNGGNGSTSVNVVKEDELFDIVETEDEDVLNLVETVSLEDSIPVYEECQNIGIDCNGHIHEKRLHELALAINRIVEVEGPIHFNEVVRRIRDFWGLKRTGPRIKNALSESVRLSQNYGDLIVKDDFLYHKNSQITVRKRINPSPKIDLISYEEIAKAIKMVIENQYATAQDDLVTQVARLLGFKSTRVATSQRINEVINEEISGGELQLMPNGMLNFLK